MSRRALHTFTSYGRSAGSARVRVFEWLDWTDLEARVHDYLGTSNNSPRKLVKEAHAVLGTERDLRRAISDVPGQSVLISRQATPFGRGGIEEALLDSSAYGVYDFDDALHLSGGRVFPKRTVWARAVKAADAIIAGNEILADAASAYHRNVVVIPSCVNPAHYHRKTDYSIGEIPRAVWIGSPSTERYLSTIATSLLRMHASHRLRLTVISAGARSLGPLDMMIDRIEWSPRTFGAALAAADFGIMPLEDTPWSRGKCAYKLLQYGASGLPLVGSPVGANRDVLTLGEGLSPVSTDEWKSALDELLSESQYDRRRRGDAAWNVIATQYSYASWESTWLRTISGS